MYCLACNLCIGLSLLFVLGVKGADEHKADRPQSLATCDTHNWPPGSVVVVQMAPQSFLAGTMPEFMTHDVNRYFISIVHNHLGFALQPAVRYMLYAQLNDSHTDVGIAHHLKSHILKSAMQHYPHALYVVYMDMDVMITHSQTHFVCLLERWGFTPHRTQEPPYMGASEDPTVGDSFELGADGRRVPHLNAGFTIWRSCVPAMHILDLVGMVAKQPHGYEWNLFSDQSVFNIYLRPALPDGAIRIIPRYEANGFDYVKRDSSPLEMGSHMTHAWHGKHLVSYVQLARLPHYLSRLESFVARANGSRAHVSSTGSAGPIRPVLPTNVSWRVQVGGDQAQLLNPPALPWPYEFKNKAGSISGFATLQLLQLASRLAWRRFDYAAHQAHVLHTVQPLVAYLLSHDMHIGDGPGAGKANVTLSQVHAAVRVAYEYIM